MFENPRRGRQERNFTTNVPIIRDLKSSSEQKKKMKIDVGCPCLMIKMIKIYKEWRSVTLASIEFNLSGLNNGYQ